MKWLKKHKTDIIRMIQFVLASSAMVSGFWFWYMLIWVAIGLPVVWYWASGCAVLAALSSLGVYVWVMKT